MNDIVKAALAERAKLMNDPLFKKIKMLDEIIANFGGTVIKTSERTGTKKDHIHELARNCIRVMGGYAKLADIHEYVNTHGVPVHTGMLKSYMYKYTDLKSSRDKGFSLKK